MFGVKMDGGSSIGGVRATAVSDAGDEGSAFGRFPGRMLVFAAALSLVWGPADAQSGWLERARQTLNGLAERLSPSTSPRHRRAVVARPLVKAPLPPQKPGKTDPPAPAVLSASGAALNLQPDPGPQATVFQTLEPERPQPPAATSIVLTPTPAPDKNASAGPVPPIVGTAFSIRRPQAPPSATGPRPPAPPQSASGARLTALPPQNLKPCGAYPAMAAEYESRPAIRNGVCVVAQPVRLQSVGGQGLRILPSATANCNLAGALAKWAQTVVAPAAQRHLGVGVVSVRNLASYACRRRNNSRSGRISEHAFANALDVGSFGLADGSEVTVLKDWKGGGAKQAFLREVHAKSCGVFKTVLGPNSDRFHATHFHLDLAKRRSTYCR